MLPPLPRTTVHIVRDQVINGYYAPLCHRWKTGGRSASRLQTMISAEPLIHSSRMPKGNISHDLDTSGRMREDYSSKMAPKNSEHGKKSWDWVRTTTPEDMRQDHVITAYRINCPACKSGCCRFVVQFDVIDAYHGLYVHWCRCSRRSGCRGNPNCIQNIGEKFWLNEISGE